MFVASVWAAHFMIFLRKILVHSRLFLQKLLKIIIRLSHSVSFCVLMNCVQTSNRGSDRNKITWSPSLSIYKPLLFIPLYREGPISCYKINHELNTCTCRILLTHVLTTTTTTKSWKTLLNLNFQILNNNCNCCTLW